MILSIKTWLPIWKKTIVKHEITEEHNYSQALSNAISDLSKYDSREKRVDNEFAKESIKAFYKVLIKEGFHNSFSARGADYYSYMLSLIPLYLDLQEQNYNAACNDLLTLCVSEDILQARKYNNLIYLVERELLTDV